MSARPAPRQWSQRPTGHQHRRAPRRGCIVSCSLSTNSAQASFPLSRIPMTRNVRRCDGTATLRERERAPARRCTARRRFVARFAGDGRCRPPTCRTASYALPRADVTPLSVRPRCRGRTSAAMRSVKACAEARRCCCRPRSGDSSLVSRWSRPASASAQALAMTLFVYAGSAQMARAAADRSRRAGRNCAADRHYRQPPLRHLLRDALALLRSPAARTTTGSRLLRGRHDGRRSSSRTRPKRRRRNAAARRSAGFISALPLRHGSRRSPRPCSASCSQASIPARSGSSSPRSSR